MQSPRLAFYFLAATMMVLCFAALYRLVNSRIGKLCQSLQQNEELASSIGVNIAYLRVIAYAISSFFGGVAGAIFAAISQSIYPSSFTVMTRQLYAELRFGGLGYVFGPMLDPCSHFADLFQTGKFPSSFNADDCPDAVPAEWILSLAICCGMGRQWLTFQRPASPRLWWPLAVNNVSFTVREGDTAVIGPMRKPTLSNLLHPFPPHVR
jgi:hypothetical protein